MNLAQVPDKEAAKLKAEGIARMMTQNYRHQHSASKRRTRRSIFNGTMQVLYKRMCLGRFCPVRDLHSGFLQQSTSLGAREAFCPFTTPQNNSDSPGSVSAGGSSLCVTSLPCCVLPTFHQKGRTCSEQQVRCKGELQVCLASGSQPRRASKAARDISAGSTDSSKAVNVVFHRLAHKSAVLAPSLHQPSTQQPQVPSQAQAAPVRSPRRAASQGR